MHLSLIGMSGSGKSRWSKNLSSAGFIRFCCDDLIAKKLQHELMRTDGSALQLGEWLGLPYEKDYPQRESKYLACEIEVLREILDHLETGIAKSQNVVVDTTGSVVYTGEEMLNRLKRRTIVIYLAKPLAARAELFKTYLEDRRPILWQRMFTRNKDETHEQALARCYPMLLMARGELYARYADVTIDCSRLNRNNFGSKEFLTFIDKQLSNKP